MNEKWSCATAIVAVLSFVLLLGAGLNTLMAADEVPTNALGPDGFIRNWILLGPFPSNPLEKPATSGAVRSGYDTDFLADLGGEAKAILTPASSVTIKAQGGAPKTLKAYPFKAWEGGHLCDRALDNAVGYAFSYVESDKDQTVYSYFGSDGSPKVWVNGKLVFSGFRAKHTTSPWEYGAKIDLKKGPNAVLVKLDNDRGWWGFQTEWYREEDHAKGFERALKGLRTHSLAADGDSAKLIVDTVPKPLGISIPVSVEIRSASPDKQVAAKATGKTGESIDIKLPSRIQGAVIVSVSSGEGLPKAVKGEDTRYIGDFSAAQAALSKRLSIAAANVSKLPKEWQPVYAPFTIFLEGFLSAKAMEPDSSDITNIVFADGFITALERGENYLTAHLGESLPGAFPSAQLRPGRNNNTYIVKIPQGFAPGKAAHPLRFFLHGAGEVGKKATYNPNKDAEAPRSTAGVPYVLVSPQSGNSRWEADALNAMLTQIKVAFSIDADRVYLGGHSMGGMGTWTWAIANPEHFAALVPMSGGGDPLRVARLVNIPVWAFQGDLDTTVPPDEIERTVAALEAAGGKVKYTLLPDAAHNRRSFDSSADDIIAFLNQHVRSTKPVPPDPIAALGLKDGLGTPTVKDLPERTCLVASGKALPEAITTAAASKQRMLFTAQRHGGHRAQGFIMIRTVGSPDADGVQGFDVLLPAHEGVKPEGELRSEKLPVAKAMCIYFQGSPKDLDLAVAKAREAAVAMGLKPTGQVFHALLSASRRGGDGLREIHVLIE